jgi:hypothetical protein
MMRIMVADHTAHVQHGLVHTVSKGTSTLLRTMSKGISSMLSLATPSDPVEVISIFEYSIPADFAAARSSEIADAPSAHEDFAMNEYGVNGSIELGNCTLDEAQFWQEQPGPLPGVMPDVLFGDSEHRLLCGDSVTSPPLQPHTPPQPTRSHVGAPSASTVAQRAEGSAAPSVEISDPTCAPAASVDFDVSIATPDVEETAVDLPASTQALWQIRARARFPAKLLQTLLKLPGTARVRLGVRSVA